MLRVLPKAKYGYEALRNRMACRPQTSKLTKGPTGSSGDQAEKPMLRFQETLPRLPVPTLEETAARYLKSIHPLLSESEYAQSKLAVEDFVKPDGIGQELQKRLIARRDDPSIRNWIHEWWMKTSYLENRGAVVPHVSYFFSYQDDSRRRDPAKRAASITSAALAFKTLVDTGKLEPEFARNAPMCMDCYTWLFNSARIPSRPADYPVRFSNTENTHIIAIRKNQFFKIAYKVRGTLLNEAELELQFDHVYRSAEDAAAVGALTSTNRDTWADARDLLAREHVRNRDALRAIDSAAFVVCLDDASPVTREERSRQYWHGDGANRWYDKPLQFIVNDNGTAGFMGEHSLMDAIPPRRLSDFVNRTIFSRQMHAAEAVRELALVVPQLLPFILTDELRDRIRDARVDFDESVKGYQLAVHFYEGYGKNLMKHFKCSPDAYVQMVIQLAHFKMYGMHRPTYESTSTRRFQLGRTETCRSVSDESVAWCSAMADASQTNTRRLHLFRKAIAAHAEYVAAASSGKGIDRHLFGLKKVLRSDEAVPAIFEDPAFRQTSTWYLSTTQVSSEYFNGLGEGPALHDGFGIAYMINDDSILFNIVSKSLDSDTMGSHLRQAADVVRELLVQGAAAPKSGL